MHFCHCHIIPKSVLEKLAKDGSLSDTVRANFRTTLRIDGAFRRVRDEARNFATEVHGQPSLAVSLATSASILVYDLHHSQSLPGLPIANPGASADASVKQAFTTAGQVAAFYTAAFGRNSVDGAGMSLLSSVHYSINYNNAFWNGSQMVYGDGDGNIFVDFTRGNDVIGHELTHGVTQYTLQLRYQNQPGGLNESLSDCFGSMFRQWQAGQTAATADWLIGKDIMGPGAASRGFTCLRDMANPAAGHCLSPQPTNFSQYKNGMDPHESSGIPNLAFCTAAKAAGGKSWEGVGKAWYAAMTAGASPSMRMKTFANRTRKAANTGFGAGSVVANAVDQGWSHVGL